MRRWIDRAVEIIVDLYDPDEIMLFGSWARNQQTLQSDIDLLIVKDTDLPRRYRGMEVASYLQKYPVDFDLLFYTQGELEQGMATEHSFVRTILGTAVTVFRKA